MLHLEILKKTACAHEYAMTISNWFDTINAREISEGLQVSCKRETQRSGKVNWIASDVRGGFVSRGTLAFEYRGESR